MSFEPFLKEMRLHFKTGGVWVHVLDVEAPPYPYLRFEAQGDTRSLPVDLLPPYRILYLCYEDMPIADNYRDLIVTINPAAKPGSKPQENGMIAVFFCEGAYEKIICYKQRMIHHYEPEQADMGRRNHYGIFATWDLPLKGPCPFCAKTQNV